MAKSKSSNNIRFRRYVAFILAGYQVDKQMEAFDELMGIKRSNRVSEEKMLNDMFVLLEYSDSFKEFVAGMSEEARLRIFEEIKKYYGD